MLEKLLGLLAWTGLWQPQLVVLNGATPGTTPARADINITDMVATTTTFMNAMVEDFVSTDGQKVFYGALERSPFYRQSLQEYGALLHNVDPRLMNETERKAFFINLYNILTIHAIVNHDPLPESTISVTNFWQRYAYKVGPFTLHLDHMEHGVLRGNRAHPTSGTVMFGPDDPRTALSLPADRRIHGALNCGALSCPPLRSYRADALEDQLEAAISGFCDKGVTRAGSDGSLVINSIFKWFRVDFASTESDALSWLSECVDDQVTRQALRQASRGERSVSYDYNWTLNAVSGGSGGKVKVEVYFSSLCSDSMRFFTNQFYPTWQKLQDIIALEFIPYGKAKATSTGTGDYLFECQHGPDECHGNRVMTCAQSSLPITTQVQFFHCMMAKHYPAYTGYQCSEELGIDWTPIGECSRSTIGAGLLYKNGVRTATLKPRITFIPTITVNGVYDQFKLRESLVDLHSQICAAYHGPPHQACL